MVGELADARRHGGGEKPRARADRAERPERPAHARRDCLQVSLVTLLASGHNSRKDRKKKHCTNDTQIDKKLKFTQKLMFVSTRQF